MVNANHRLPMPRMLTRPAGHEAKAEARKSEAEDEAEVTWYVAEARHCKCSRPRSQFLWGRGQMPWGLDRGRGQKEWGHIGLEALTSLSNTTCVMNIHYTIFF